MKIGHFDIHRRKPRRIKRQPMPPEFLLPLLPCNIPPKRCTVSREQASQRILILRLGAFGDILMGTPLLAALRNAYPDAHITWVAEFTEREAIDANPYVDEILCWDTFYWKRMIRNLQYPLWFARAWRLKRELKARRFDIFISLQPEEWPLLLLGTDAPVSIGIFDTFRRYYGESRNRHYQRLYTHPYAAPRLPNHRIDQYGLALQALGLPSPEPVSMSMGYMSEDASNMENFLHSQGYTSGQDFVALAPMTTWPTKCWPMDRYVALGDALARRHGCRIIIIGSAKERPALEDIAARMEIHPIVMAGELNFRQAAALLHHAALLVSGDTGPMHVAAALGTPQIALFGPTSPEWYGPRSRQALVMAHLVPCGPCDRKVCHNADDPHLCMRLLSVEEALHAASSLLGKRVSV